MSGCKTVAVLQSSYIPWKGYFDLIHDADEFIFYDDVQFTRQDWRSRNQIVTPNGVIWLSIPTGGDIRRLIHEVELTDHRWQGKHWRSIQQSYAKSPYFRDYKEFFEDLYLGHTWNSLSALNQHTIQAISKDLLGITTRFSDSRDYSAQGAKLDRLVDIVRKSQATVYVSGPSAAAYIDPAVFREIDVQLIYKNYEGYPEYPQGRGAFSHNVSVLDLLFQVGPRAPEYIWGWRSTAQESCDSRPV